MKDEALREELRARFEKTGVFNSIFGEDFIYFDSDENEYLASRYFAEDSAYELNGAWLMFQEIHGTVEEVRKYISEVTIGDGLMAIAICDDIIQIIEDSY